LAEGWLCDDTVGIANNNEEYRKLVKEFADKYTMGYYERCKLTNQLSNTSSYTVYIQSVLLRKIIFETCGKLSHNKKVPSFVYTANNEFLNGFFDGYFSGDWCAQCAETGCQISSTSASKQLLIGLSTVLTRFGIVSKITTKSPRKESSLPSTQVEKLRTQYTLTIRNCNIKLFHDKVNFVIDYKQHNMKKLNKLNFKNECGMFDKIPGTKLEASKYLKHGKHTQLYKDLENGIIHHTDVTHLYTEHFNKLSNDEKIILKEMIDSDIYFDQVVSIEEVTPSNTYVYDLTVKNTKNFCLENALMMRDSFHHSGIASMSSTVQGLPRMKELLSVSKNQKFRKWLFV
jgi:Intein/homing endonuclease